MRADTDGVPLDNAEGREPPVHLACGDGHGRELVGGCGSCGAERHRELPLVLVDGAAAASQDQALALAVIDWLNRSRFARWCTRHGRMVDKVFVACMVVCPFAYVAIGFLAVLYGRDVAAVLCFVGAFLTVEVGWPQAEAASRRLAQTSKEMPVESAVERTYWKIDLGSSDAPDETGRRTSEEADANCVSSLLVDGRNAPLLDLDIPHRYVPSSTEGHGHLYLDVPLDRDRWELLMTTLGAVGILEPGYVTAAIKRGHSELRLPHVKKNPRTEPNA